MGAPPKADWREERRKRAFELGAEGLSDRAIAQALNAAGYRTHGTHGSNPFTKDTVRAMLLNRFYLGELPGERPASAAPVRHPAVIGREVWEVARAMREQRATQARATVPHTATVYSLSGLAVCGQCSSHLHIQPAKGRPRLYCAGRRQGKTCTSHSAALAIYDDQIAAYLGTFVIPHDFQTRLYEYVVATRPNPQQDTAEQRRRLETQIERLRDLYVLGDIDKARYLAERERLKRELALLDARTHEETSRLTGLADLLANVAAAWAAARPEQRNRLARLLFDEVVINDERVAAVKPRPELAGFFLLDFQKRAGLSHEYRTGGPDGVGFRSARNVFAASLWCRAAGTFGSSRQSSRSERMKGPAWFVRVSSIHGTPGRARAPRSDSWTPAVRVGAAPSAPRWTRTWSRSRACVATGRG
jgi:hypothetical protein